MKTNTLDYRFYVLVIAYTLNKQILGITKALLIFEHNLL